MSRLSPVLFVAALAALTACATQNHVEEHTFDGDVDTVHLEAGSANVTIVAVEGLDGARILETSRWSDEPPQLDFSLSDGELNVAADCAFRLAVSSVCSVDLTIEVPAEAGVVGVLTSGDTVLDGLLGGVRLSTDSGDITLRGLGGEVTIDAGSGNVTGEGLAAASVEITVGSGDVEVVQATRPRDVWLEAGSGNLTLTLPGGDYEVATSTSSGDVDVSGVAHTPGADASVDLHTGSGDITLTGR